MFIYTAPFSGSTAPAAWWLYPRAVSQGWSRAFTELPCYQSLICHRSSTCSSATSAGLGETRLVFTEPSRLPKRMWHQFGRLPLVPQPWGTRNVLFWYWGWGTRNSFLRHKFPATHRVEAWPWAWGRGCGLSGRSWLAACEGGFSPHNGRRLNHLSIRKASCAAGPDRNSLFIPGPQAKL